MLPQRTSAASCCGGKTSRPTSSRWPSRSCRSPSPGRHRCRWKNLRMPYLCMHSHHRRLPARRLARPEERTGQGEAHPTHDSEAAITEAGIRGRETPRKIGQPARRRVTPPIVTDKDTSCASEVLVQVRVPIAQVIGRIEHEHLAVDSVAAGIEGPVACIESVGNWSSFAQAS